MNIIGPPSIGQLVTPQTSTNDLFSIVEHIYDRDLNIVQIRVEINDKDQRFDFILTTSRALNESQMAVKQCIKLCRRLNHIFHSCKQFEKDLSTIDTGTRNKTIINYVKKEIQELNFIDDKFEKTILFDKFKEILSENFYIPIEDLNEINHLPSTKQIWYPIIGSSTYSDKAKIFSTLYFNNTEKEKQTIEITENDINNFIGLFSDLNNNLAQLYSNYKTAPIIKRAEIFGQYQANKNNSSTFLGPFNEVLPSIYKVFESKFCTNAEESTEGQCQFENMLNSLEATEKPVQEKQKDNFTPLNSQVYNSFTFEKQDIIREYCTDFADIALEAIRTDPKKEENIWAILQNLQMPASVLLNENEKKLCRDFIIGPANKQEEFTDFTKCINYLTLKIKENEIIKKKNDFERSLQLHDKIAVKAIPTYMILKKFTLEHGILKRLTFASRLYVNDYFVGFSHLSQQEINDSGLIQKLNLNICRAKIGNLPLYTLKEPNITRIMEQYPENVLTYEDASLPFTVITRGTRASHRTAGTSNLNKSAVLQKKRKREQRTNSTPSSTNIVGLGSSNGNVPTNVYPIQSTLTPEKLRTPMELEAKNFHRIPWHIQSLDQVIKFGYYLFELHTDSRVKDFLKKLVSTLKNNPEIDQEICSNNYPLELKQYYTEIKELSNGVDPKDISVFICTQKDDKYIANESLSPNGLNDQMICIIKTLNGYQLIIPKDYLETQEPYYEIIS